MKAAPAREVRDRAGDDSRAGADGVRAAPRTAARSAAATRAPARLAYRPDIDGLRAVAIISVILFHFGLGAPGGYIGVDVFFVISGYLITQGLLLQPQPGLPTIIGFWARRLRRLLPALVVVGGATTVVGFFLLMPDELVAFGKTLFASLFFYSNELFHSQANYFDAPSLTKPFLHTWSLGVEAQFYLVFPLVASLLFTRVSRGRRSLSSVLLAALLLGSLAWSIIVLRSEASRAFYSLPTRAWELLAGSLLAYAAPPRIGDKRLNFVLQLAGVACIVWPAYAYSANTVFPGAAALLPVFGAFVLIYSHEAGMAAPASRLLELPPFVWIGKISYSLYLWHWPLLVLLPYVAGRHAGAATWTVALAITTALSALTYRFVERPFNNWRHSPPVKFALLACLATACAVVLAASLLIERSQGFPSRLSATALAFSAGRKDVAPAADRCHTISPERVLRGELCDFSPANGRQPQFVVWGDSHAHALYGVFDKLATEYQLFGKHGSYAACPPLLGVRIATHANDACERFNDAMIDYINERRIPTVILTARWALYASGNPPGGLETGPEPRVSEAKRAARQASAAVTSEALFARGLEETLRRLAAPGRAIYLVEQAPEALYDLPSALARSTLPFALGQGDLRPLRAATEARQRSVNDTFAALGARYGARVIGIRDFLCDAKTCEVAHDGRSLYRDADHLSSFGADFVAPPLRPIFEQARRAAR